VISGRPNVFSMFFAAGLAALRPGGMLGFVVPPSMNNGAYFERLRRHLASQASIEHLEILDGHGWFAEAQQSVQLIVLRKGARSQRYQFRRPTGDANDTPRDRLIFTPDPARLARHFAGRRTLHELGFEAVTGTVVWNQNRARLRRARAGGAIPLIWSHNIVGGAIELRDDHRRPQYIVGKESIRGPAIVVNRITGAVGGGELRAGLVGRGVEFVGENHVNVIRARAGATPRVPWRKLLSMLRDARVRERVRALTGNTQISATELTHLIPLNE
jgi:adenine-specific DNA-methyltransferase